MSLPFVTCIFQQNSPWLQYNSSAGYPECQGSHYAFNAVQYNNYITLINKLNILFIVIYSQFSSLVVTTKWYWVKIMYRKLS